MTDEDLVRARQLTQSSLREAVKFVAPRFGVSPDELLQKLPQFPVNPNEPGEVAAFIAELKLKGKDLTTTESEVVMAVSGIMIGILQAAIARQNRGLPGFSE